MIGRTTILAHQGGWDEFLLVAGPIAVFVLLLWLANRRADQQLRSRAADDAAPHDTATAPDDTAERSSRGGRPGGQI